MTKRFEGKIVLATGAAGGIGRKTALEFANEGATVVLSDINEQMGRKALEEIKSAGAEESIFVTADVTEISDVDRLFATIFGGFGRLDIAVNNAGMEGIVATIDQQTEENFEKVIATNLRSVFHFMRAELAIMRPQGQGVIVNLASIAAHISFPGLSVYTASKHAVLGMTKVVAQEFIREGIRVSAVSPGIVDTPMLDRFLDGSKEAKAGMAATLPINRACLPEEIARGVLFMASADADLMVGQTLNMDGGWAFVKP